MVEEWMLIKQHILFIGDLQNIPSKYWAYSPALYPILIGDEVLYEPELIGSISLENWWLCN